MRFGQKWKRVILILSYLLVSAIHPKAQTNMVFYPIENQNNSLGFNPAFLTTQRNYSFSIFPLSGMNVGYNNQLVIKDMVTNILKGNQTNDDFREVFNSMLKLDLFYQRMETNLLSFGFNSGFGSFDFRIKENMQIMTNLKGEFSDFLTSNSSQAVLVNNPQIFPALALHYREYSLGFAREIIKEKLTLGLRAKLYIGKLSVKSDVQGQVVQNSDDKYLLQINNPLYISFPIHIVQNADGSLKSVEPSDDFSVGSYLTNSKNMGVGVDIGLTYKINPDFVLSASVLDLGKINWKSNLNQMTFDGKYQFPQNYIVSDVNGVLIRNADFTADKVNFEELYKVTIAKSPYSTWMPITIYSGLKYKANPNLSLNILNRLVTTKNMNFNSTSITGVYNVKKNLAITSGYSIIGKSYNNIPFAIQYTSEAGQYFIGTDNLLSFMVPSLAQFSGATFGMCLFLFRSKTKYEEQLKYLPFYQKKKQKKGTNN